MFGPQFHYSVMSGLVHPGFTGGHSPLEGEGRAGWGRGGLAALPNVQHLPAESPVEYEVLSTAGSIGMTHIWLEFLGCWQIQNGARMKLCRAHGMRGPGLSRTLGKATWG